MQRGRLKVSLILTVLVICFIFPVLKPVHAQEAGYSHMCYTTFTVPTINGQWSSDWSSGLQTTFGSNAVFTDEWYLAAINPSTVYYYLIIETMDNTNDSKDFIQISLDGGMTADSAPTSTDFAINFTSNAVCTWYQGNGVGWTKIATPTSSVFQWGESFGSSPTYKTPHLILELSLLKTSTVLGSTQILGPEFWMLIETYDANSAGYGLQSWPAVPPSNPDVPSTYGDIPYTSTVNPASTPTLASSSAPTPTPTPTSTPTPTPTLTPTSNPSSKLMPTSTPISTQPSSANPWFGYEAIGKQVSHLPASETITLCNYTTPPNPVVITQINIYLTGVPQGSSVSALIFANEPQTNFPKGGEPIAQSLEKLTVTSVTGQWYNFTMNYSTSPNTVYWLGYYSDQPTSYFFDDSNNSVAVTSQPRDANSSVLPVSWSFQGKSVMSLYALYTNAEKAPSPTTAHPNSDTQTSSFGDTLFILGVIGMETLIVATHQASGRKQFPLPKKA